MPDGRTLPQATVHVSRSRHLADRLYELLRVRNFHQRRRGPHRGPALRRRLSPTCSRCAACAAAAAARASRPRPTARTLTLGYSGPGRGAAQDVISFEEPPESHQGRARCASACAWRRASQGRAIHYDVRVEAPDAPRPSPATSRDQPQRRAPRLRALARPAPPTSSPTTSRSTGVLRRGQADLRMLAADLSTATRCRWPPCPGSWRPSAANSLIVGLETLMLDLRWARRRRALPRAPPGAHRQRLSRGAAGQDHARAAPRRAGRPAAPYRTRPTTARWTPRALYLLLVCEVGHVDRRPRVLRAAARATSTPPCAGSTSAATTTATASSSTAALARRAAEPGLARRRRRHRARRRHAGAAAPSPWPRSQGYVYYAKRRLASHLRAARRRRASPSACSAGSQALKLRFNERFWMEDEGYVAMALDGDKRQVQHHGLDRRPLPVVAHRGRRARAGGGATASWRPTCSRAGACAPWRKDVARLQPHELLQRQRVALRQRAHRRNGLKKHGFTQEANRLAGACSTPPSSSSTRACPSSFCGFTRQAVNRPVSPTPWPARPTPRRRARCSSCCRPCWASTRSAEENMLYVHNPLLPKWLGEVTLSNLERGPLQHAACAFAATATRPLSRCCDKQGGVRIVVVE